MKFRKSIINGRSGKVEYEYTGNDLIRKIIYPSKTAVYYDYYPSDQVRKIRGFGGELRDFHYFSSGAQRGLLKDYTRSNGQKVNFSWDERRRLEYSRHNKMSLSYDYWDRGNLKNFNRSPGNNQSYTYDDLNRLETFTGKWGTGMFEYDDYDNREKKTVNNVVTDYSYNNINNKLESFAGKNVGYYYGHINRIKDMVITYSPFKNITTIKKDNKQIGYYLYDGQNRRVFKSSDNPTTIHYHYGQSDNVLSEISGNGTPLADYIYFGNTLVAKSVHTLTPPPLPDKVNVVPPNYLLLKE
jgi:hypothetical protein